MSQNKLFTGIRGMIVAYFWTWISLEITDISEFLLRENQMALLLDSKKQNPKTAFSRCLGSRSSWPDRLALLSFHTDIARNNARQRNKPQTLWLPSVEKIMQRHQATNKHLKLKPQIHHTRDFFLRVERNGKRRKMAQENKQLDFLS